MQHSAVATLVRPAAAVGFEVKLPEPGRPLVLVGALGPLLVAVVGGLLAPDVDPAGHAEVHDGVWRLVEKQPEVLPLTADSDDLLAGEGLGEGGTACAGLAEHVDAVGSQDPSDCLAH